MKCFSCDNLFSSISHHWALSECNPPELSEEQKELLLGALLGDGTVFEVESGCKLRLQMKNKEFINWFSDEIGWLSNSISKTTKDYKGYEIKLYQVDTKPHSWLYELREWYFACGGQEESVIRKIFENSRFDVEPKFNNGAVYFSVEDSKTLWSNIDESIKGFDYKVPNR